jgi:hypothetical protein
MKLLNFLKSTVRCGSVCASVAAVLSLGAGGALYAAEDGAWVAPASRKVE